MKRAAGVALFAAALVAAFAPGALAARPAPAVTGTIDLAANGDDATAFAVAVNPATHMTYVTPGFEPLGCESHVTEDEIP